MTEMFPPDVSRKLARRISAIRSPQEQTRVREAVVKEDFRPDSNISNLPASVLRSLKIDTP